MKSWLERMDSWIRRKLRTYIWKQWKRVSAKFKNLMKYGASKNDAWKWANSRKGYWRIAKSQVLHTTLTNKVLKELGYDELSGRYHKLLK
jgi:hypothetical protein